MIGRWRWRAAVLSILLLLPGCASPLLVPMVAVSGTTVAGGLLYRERGGAVDLGLGTQGARLLWAVPTGLLVAGLAGAWWLAPVVAGTTLAGQVLGHAGHQRSGAGLAGEPESWRQDTRLTGWLPALFGPYDRTWPAWRKEAWHYAGMTTVAVVRATLVVAPALAVDPALGWVILTGLFPAYYLGWRTPSDLPGLEQGSEVAEFLTGAALFFALMVVAGI